MRRLVAAALALSALGPGGAAAQRVVLRHETLGALPDREPPVIVVQVDGNQHAIDELRVSYREVGRADFAVAIMRLAPDGRATARLPLLETDASYAIQYYIEARSSEGAVLGRVGSEEAPLQVTVPAGEESAAAAPEEEPPQEVPLAPPEEEEQDEEPAGERRGVASRWWLWTLIGAVVIGAGVTAGVLLAGSDGGPNGSLGTFRLGD